MVEVGKTAIDLAFWDVGLGGVVLTPDVHGRVDLYLNGGFIGQGSFEDLNVQLSELWLSGLKYLREERCLTTVIFKEVKKGSEVCLDPSKLLLCKAGQILVVRGGISWLVELRLHGSFGLFLHQKIDLGLS